MNKLSLFQVARLEQSFQRVDKLAFSLIFIRDYIQSHMDGNFEYSSKLLDNMGALEATVSVICEGLLTELEDFGDVLTDLRKALEE